MLNLLNGEAEYCVLQEDYHIFEENYYKIYRLQNTYCTSTLQYNEEMVFHLSSSKYYGKMEGRWSKFCYNYTSIIIGHLMSNLSEWLGSNVVSPTTGDQSNSFHLLVALSSFCIC